MIWTPLAKEDVCFVWKKRYFLVLCSIPTGERSHRVGGEGADSEPGTSSVSHSHQTPRLDPSRHVTTGGSVTQLSRHGRRHDPISRPRAGRERRDGKGGGDVTASSVAVINNIVSFIGIRHRPPPSLPPVKATVTVTAEDLADGLVKLVPMSSVVTSIISAAK